MTEDSTKSPIARSTLLDSPHQEVPMTLTGIVSNGVVILDPGQTLPEGTRVKVSVNEEAVQAASPLGAALLRHAGKAQGLREDLAAQHDHYLYGTPKR